MPKKEENYHVLSIIYPHSLLNVLRFLLRVTWLINKRVVSSMNLQFGVQERNSIQCKTANCDIAQL